MARILLVDDDPEIRSLTRRILENNGYKVSVVVDGKECIDVLEKDRPDLILLDVMMPGLDGWEVCMKIKADAKTRDIPVVMFTVRTSEDSVEKSLNYAMADAQINKPFKMKKLLDTVDRLLKTSK